MHKLVTLINWCAYMQDFDDTIIEKQVVNARVILYENKTVVKPERREEDQHLGILPRKSWQSKNRLALAVKWAILPIETLMDEQFLTILHAIEEITDVTPLEKQLYSFSKDL